MVTTAPPTSKISDIITSFRPTRLFKASAAYSSIDFDDSGEFLLLSRSDDTIQLFNTKAGAHAKELKSQKYGSNLARFTHHSTSILYASTKVDDGIRYLSMHDNSFIRYFRGHTDRVTALCVSPGNDQFLSASLDGTVRLWDVRSPNAQGLLRFNDAAGPWLTAYDASASVIAIASSAARCVVLYDLRNYDKPPFAHFDLLEAEQRLVAMQPQQVAGEGWTGLEFSNNGRYILISTNGVAHYLIDAFSGELLHYLRRPAGADPAHFAPGNVLPTPMENPSNPKAVETPTFLQASANFSPDGRYVIGGNAPKTDVLVWDAQQEPTANKILDPTAELPSTKPARLAAYNPRHNLLASADREVMLWLPDLEVL